jgi:sec-independent protein translocase protein TatC
VSEDDRSDIPFLDHLEELRRRLLKAGAACIVGTVGSWFFVDYVIDLIAGLVGEVYFMAPTEAFLVRLKLSIIMGIMLAVPVISYQLWRFVSPGLYSREKLLVVPVVLAATIFFALGAGFCYFIVLPAAIEFLMGYGTENMTPLISIGNLLSFAGYLVLAFGVVFELPVVAFFLGRIGIVSHKMLAKGRRYAVILSLVLGATLTPPDLFSQVMLAGPLLILYEFSIWLVRFTGKKVDEGDLLDDDEREIGLGG